MCKGFSAVLVARLFLFSASGLAQIVPHTASLSWTASASSNVAGYKIYRGTASGGPYTILNLFPIVGTSYIDATILAGGTYYYVVTAVDDRNNESVYSNEARAVVPSQPILGLGLSCNPASLNAPGASTCTVILNGPAQSGFVTVSLSSSNTSLVTVPGTVSVPPGTSSATFVVTAAPVSVIATVQLTASVGGASQTFALTLTPSQGFLSGFSCSPPALVSPGISTCTVSLNTPAPTGGVIVSLGSSNASLLTVPGSVSVPPGASSAAFVVTAAPVNTLATIQLTASFGGVSQSTALTLSAGRPLLVRTGVVNAASLLPGSVAPGEVITIFGLAMGPATGVGATLNSAGLIDSSLASVRVLFDGAPAALAFVQSGQINAVTPYAVQGRTSTQLQVEYGGIRSDPVTLPVADTAPAIFTLDYSGRGNGAILNQDGSINSPSNPASRASVVVLFATGEGQTFPAGVDGKPAADPFPRPIHPVRAIIGGIDAEILYAGSAPGLVAGVLQVNARIPDGVPPGNAVPVSLVIGELNSQPGVTLAVKF